MSLPPRPHLAIVGNCPSPYRTTQHLRYVEAFSWLRISSLFLYATSAHSWHNPLPEEIHPVVLAPGSSIVGRHSLRGIPLQLQTSGRVWRWLAAEQPDVVLLTGYADVSFVAAMRWCRRTRTPYILYSDSNVAGDRVHGARAFAKRAFLRRAVRGASVVGATSRAGLRYFYRYGAELTPTVFLPPQPDFHLFSPMTRAASSQSSRRRRFIASGRLVPEKRIDTLIRAFALVADRLPGWDLVVAGDGPERERLQAIVPPTLAGRVEWTGFIANQSDLAELYRRCDVLVVPSAHEPWGVVVLEAAAIGLGLVVSDAVGAAVELVEAGRNGMSFPSGDVDALAACLVEASTASDRWGEESREVLLDWCRRSDPVEGLRLALTRCGVCPDVEGDRSAA